jgi:hypothetical protein
MALVNSSEIRAAMTVIAIQQAARLRGKSGREEDSPQRREGCAEFIERRGEGCKLLNWYFYTATTNGPTGASWRPRKS